MTLNKLFKPSFSHLYNGDHHSKHTMVENAHKDLSHRAWYSIHIKNYLYGEVTGRKSVFISVHIDTHIISFCFYENFFARSQLQHAGYLGAACGI